MAAGDVYRGIRGRVRTKTGTVSIRRGDKMPADAEKGEAKRLKDLGMLGKPFELPAAALTAAEEEAAAAEAQRAAADESGEAAPSEAGEVSGQVPAVSSTEELDTMIATSTVDELIEFVGDDADRAQAVIEAEQAVNGDEARKSLIEALEKRTAPDEPPAEE